MNYILHFSPSFPLDKKIKIKSILDRRTKI